MLTVQVILLNAEVVEFHVNALHLGLGREESVLLALDVHLLLAEESFFVVVFFLQASQLEMLLLDGSFKIIDFVQLLAILVFYALIVCLLAVSFYSIVTSLIYEGFQLLFEVKRFTIFFNTFLIKIYKFVLTSLIYCFLTLDLCCHLIVFQCPKNFTQICFTYNR